MNGRSDTPRITVIARPDDEAVEDFLTELVGDDDEWRDRIDVVRPESAEGMTDAATRAASNSVATVAAVGGDGSLNLVVAGLVGTDTSVVSVPAGTVNLIAQVLGTDSIESAAEAVRSGSARSIDVGESDDGIFVMNASSGYDAAVIDDADDHSDARFGRLQFLLAGLRRLRRDRPRRVSVVVDDETWFDGRAMSVIVMNVGQRASSGFDVAPDAEPDDGLLDVVVVRCSTVRRMLVVVARLASGRPVDETDVVYSQGARVVVQWESTVTCQRDGDAGKSRARFEYGVRPRSLRIHAGRGPTSVSGDEAKGDRAP